MFHDVGFGSGSVPFTGDFTTVNQFVHDASTTGLTISWTAKGSTPKTYAAHFYTTGGFFSVDNDIGTPLATSFSDGTMTIYLEQTAATVQNTGLMVTIFY